MTKERFENSWHNVRGVSEEELRGDPEVIRKYGDILDTKWDGVRKHQRANMDVRAAQFSPFAALTGYDDEIRETARITEKELVLSEDKKEALDRKLQYISDKIKEKPEINVTFFVPDDKKAGGEYVTKSGFVRRIDMLNGGIIFTDGSIVPISKISDIDLRL